MKKIQLLSSLFLAVIIAASCAEQKNESDPNLEKAYSEEVRLFADTTIYVSNLDDSIEVLIDYPEYRSRGTIILLPGWNFSNTDWCDSTDLCTQLSNEGFVVVLPDMKKSIYAWNRYPQTRKDWYKMPTRRWFMDTLIPSLKSLQLLNYQEINGLIGLSTGARGALLLGIEGKGLFSHLVCLSGDYDQNKFPKDNLYKGYYGSIEEHPECYIGIENPIDRLSTFKGKMLILHGAQDEVVNVEHSRRLIVKLKEINADYKYVEIPNAKHNYTFWGNESNRIIDFLAN